MAKTVYQRMEATIAKIMEQGGDCIMVCRDGVSDTNMLTCVVREKEDVKFMFANLFQKFPFLIPEALCGLSMATGLVFSDDDLDDDDDPDDEDPEDGVPVGGCGATCDFCMN